MSKIVDNYIKVDEMFRKCVENQLEGCVSFDDMRIYYALLDGFVRTAREYYSDSYLDVSSAIEMLNSDPIIQEELKQYEENINSGIKKN